MKQQKLLQLLEKFEHYYLFDQQKDLQNPILRKSLVFFTELGSSFVIIGFLAILAIIEDTKIAIILIPIYLFQLSIIELIKITFKRKRPHTFRKENILRINFDTGSFPSGHTSNIFSLAFLLSNFYETNIIITSILFLIAATVAASRLFLGKHYFIDVFAGGILGVLLTYLGSIIWIMVLTYLQIP